MNIRRVGDELLHEDGRVERQTDGHDEANRRFLDFAIAPNKCTLLVPEDINIFCLDCNIHI